MKDLINKPTYISKMYFVTKLQQKKIRKKLKKRSRANNKYKYKDKPMICEFIGRSNRYKENYSFLVQPTHASLGTEDVNGYNFTISLGPLDKRLTAHKHNKDHLFIKFCPKDAQSAGLRRIFRMVERLLQYDKGTLDTDEHLIECLLPDFETLEDVTDESEVRQACLEKFETTEHLSLADDLHSCNEDAPCRSGACPVCYRSYRIEIISSILKFYQGEKPDWLAVTLIFYSDAMTDEDFTVEAVKKLVNKLRRQLKRVGITGPVVGNFDICYHPESKKWMPHFHLLIPDQEALRPQGELKKYMTRSKNMNTRPGIKDVPMKVDCLKDPAEQISYPFKSYWSRVYAYRSNGKRRTKPVRLRDEQHAISLLVLDRLGTNGAILPKGLQKRSSHLKPNVSDNNE